MNAAGFTFSKIFFAIAMMFMQPDDKITKISVSMDGKAGATWTLQADGTWLGTESIQAPGTESGTWAYDAAKKTITHTPPVTQPDAKPETTDLSTLLKAGPEKPDPATLEIQGKTINAVRTGSDITLMPKDVPEGRPAPPPVIIHFEKAGEKAAAQPAPATAPAPESPAPAR